MNPRRLYCLLKIEDRPPLEVFQEQIIPKPVTVTDYSTDMTMPWDSIFPVLFCFLSVGFFFYSLPFSQYYYW